MPIKYQVFTIRLTQAFVLLAFLFYIFFKEESISSPAPSVQSSAWSGIYETASLGEVESLYCETYSSKSASTSAYCEVKLTSTAQGVRFELVDPTESLFFNYISLTKSGKTGLQFSEKTFNSASPKTYERVLSMAIEQAKQKAYSQAQ